METFLNTSTCLISVTIQKIQKVFEGNVADEFVGLKLKMHLMKTIDGKE